MGFNSAFKGLKCLKVAFQVVQSVEEAYVHSSDVEEKFARPTLVS